MKKFPYVPVAVALIGFACLAYAWHVVVRDAAEGAAVIEQGAPGLPPQFEEHTIANPIAMIGTYNCNGWAGVIIVMSDGSISDLLSMRPEEALALQKKLGLDPAKAKHVFPAQNDRGHGAPYQQQAPDGDDEQKPASPLTHEDGRQTL